MRIITIATAMCLIACSAALAAQVPGGNVRTPDGDAQTPSGNAQPLRGDTQAPGANAQFPGANLQTPDASPQAPHTNVRSQVGNSEIPRANAQAPGANSQALDADLPKLGGYVQVPKANVQTPGVTAPNAFNGGALSQDPENWRYIQYDGLWWYWTPENAWMVWSNNQWGPYSAGTIRDANITGYRDTDGQSGYASGYTNGYDYYGGRYRRGGRRARRWGY